MPNLALQKVTAVRMHMEAYITLLINVGSTKSQIALLVRTCLPRLIQTREGLRWKSRRAITGDVVHVVHVVLQVSHVT